MLSVALLKSVATLWSVPPFQAPDEYGHYDYVLYLSHVSPAAFVRGDHLRNVELAPLAFATREVRCLAEASGAAAHFDDARRFRPHSWSDTTSRAGACRDIDTAAEVSAATELNLLLNHPPLYYATAAAVVRVLRGAGVDPFTIYSVIRLFSIILFVATLWLAWLLTRRLRLAPVAAAAVLIFVALQPQLTLLAVSVQPDMLGLLLVTAATLALVDTATTGRRTSAAAFGGLVGLLLLTKLHLALPLAAGGIGASLAASLVHRSPWRRQAGLVTSATVPALAVGGWWYVRSAWLFDNVVGVMTSAPHPEAGEGALLARAAHFATSRLGDTFLSYWGRWGWLDFGFEFEAIPGLLALSLAPLVVVVVFAALGLGSSHTRAADRLDGIGVALVIGTLAVFAVEMFAITLWAGPVNDQGRHWLPFVVAQGLLFSWPAQVASHRLPAAWTRAHRGRLISLAGGVSLAAALALATAVTTLRAPLGVASLDLRTSVDSTAEIYVDSGAGFNPAERERTAVRRRDGWHRVDVPLRQNGVRALRLDLLAGPGVVEVESITLSSLAPPAERPVPLDEVTALHEVALRRDAAGRLVFEAPPEARDPQAVVSLAPPLKFEPAGPGGPWTRVVKDLGWRATRRVPWLPVLLDAWWLLALAGITCLAGAGAAARRFAPVSLGVAYVLTLAGVLAGINIWLLREAAAFYSP